METDESREEQPLDSLVAVGTWTDMTVRYVELDRIVDRICTSWLSFIVNTHRTDTVLGI